MNRFCRAPLLYLATFIVGCSNPTETKFTMSFCRTALECNEIIKDVRFHVTEEKNIVVAKFHRDNKLVTSDFFKECTIISNEEWVCKSDNEKLGYSYKIKRVGNLIETTDANIKFTKTN